MPRPYEVVYIFDSTLEEAAINERLARFHALVQRPGVDSPQVDHWGKRTLAYPIRKREIGYYVVTKFDAEQAALPEFERAIKLDEGVLRYLLTIYEHELGAPPMTEEELAAARRREAEEDEDEE